MTVVSYPKAELIAAQAFAVKEQPRKAANHQNRRILPHANPSRQDQSFLLTHVPLDCRLLIWEHVLQTPHTRLERWRPPCKACEMSDEIETLDADCFPYRMTTAGREKLREPLALLRSCRQLYAECLKVLYATTFVISSPADLFSFRLIGSPEGLLNVKNLILAIKLPYLIYGGPFSLYRSTEYAQDAWKEWEGALHDLWKLSHLQELQVWLRHCSTKESNLLRRPWKEGTGTEVVEQLHQKLFDLFGAVKVPNFTVNLTWNPEDLLSQREWPFKAILKTAQEIDDAWSELPEPTEMDLYD